jgi:lipoprotein NlpD
MTRIIVGLVCLLLCACESNPPAPVITRAPQASKPKPPASAKPISPATKDWRPDNHIVKKGDTLFSIGLEYGIDYKEIASANNITPPYPIKIGQKLDLTSFKTKAIVTTATADPNNASQTEEEGVVVTAIKAEAPVTTVKSAQDPNKPVVSAVTPILTEPKATREAYSTEALNRLPSKPAEASTAPNKSAEIKPVESNTMDDEAITWTWPAQGKVSASFNEASNKGIDIAGTAGQSILATSSGKVIYSGSDLRGYGKLVIVKHNKTYLSVYAHNSKIVVKEGQVVSAGQKIAEMGNTDTNAVKLHFEIRRLGKSVDPAKYLN